MRLGRKVALLVTSMLLALGAATGLASTAQAAGQICAQSGTGYCLNDWNGGGIGASIKMGLNGWPNQGFSTVQLTGMCGHGVVTGTCPFANLALDSILAGEPIVKVKYNGAGGGCVGTGNTDNRAFLVVCPDSNGNGGGWGSVFVEDFGCNVHLDNRHWTDAGGTSTPHDLVSGGATGAQAVVSTDRSGSSCWGTG